MEKQKQEYTLCRTCEDRTMQKYVGCRISRDRLVVLYRCERCNETNEVTKERPNRLEGEL